MFCVADRYASLYFIMVISKDDNELVTLETIHMFVEVLDRYFGNVSLKCTSACSARKQVPMCSPGLFGSLFRCGNLKVCELDIIFNFHKVSRQASSMLPSS